MKMVMMWVLLLLSLLALIPHSSACYADDRNSLLDFKEGLNFTSSLSTLQSWKGFNCCAWEGITCHLLALISSYLHRLWILINSFVASIICGSKAASFVNYY
ncbi:hypothetical protein SUGI_0292950 [Cryptomeria japonica]|nr:hypothetical protein SUGI_0292950 [Cryptomeria japonica]